MSVTEGGVTTQYLYDGLLPALERRGGATAANTWGLSYGGGIGGLLARTTSAGTLYPLYDGTGNILAWTDGSGAVTGTIAYTAFGEVIAQTGTSQPFTFSTKASSAGTGLSYFGARYYSPALARWLTPDPLGMVVDTNLYSYVLNDPVSLIDPWGLKDLELQRKLANEKLIRGVEIIHQGHTLVEVGIAAGTIGAVSGNAYITAGGTAVGLLGVTRWVYGGYLQARGIRELVIIRNSDARETGVEPEALLY